MSHPTPLQRPHTWQLVVAFAVLYTAWGTTYLAIREGVKTLPPGLFGGVRVASAGAVLLAFVAARGGSLRVGRRELAWLAVVGGLGLMGTMSLNVLERRRELGVLPLCPNRFSSAAAESSIRFSRDFSRVCCRAAARVCRTTSTTCRARIFRSHAVSSPSV